MKISITVIFGIVLTSCGLFDSDSEGITGEYTIGWIDTECTRTIRYGPIGQMEGEIYELGWDEDFILAKRHPFCKKSETDFFIIDINKNAGRGKVDVGGRKDIPCIYDCRFGVFGPYNEETFNSKRRELGVPGALRFTNSF